MINPNLIVEALVTKLRAIPQLVALLEGSANAIEPYYDSYPDANSLRDAIYRMPRPGILVTFEGHDVVRNGPRRYRLKLYLRAPAQSLSPSGGYGAMLKLIEDGTPSGGDGLIMYSVSVHADCLPMSGNDGGDLPSSRRSNLVIDEVGNTIDYFESSIVFRELRDVH